MRKDLVKFAAKALPSLSGSSLTYNAEKNLLLTLGYTSNSGNTYYRAIRFSDSLVVYYDLGEGYFYTFLNGITLYAWNGTSARLIAKKQWGGSDWRTFSESFAKQESIKMVKEYLASQAKCQGLTFSDSELLSFAQKAIEQTRQKRLA